MASETTMAQKQLWHQLWHQKQLWQQIQSRNSEKVKTSPTITTGRSNKTKIFSNKNLN